MKQYKVKNCCYVCDKYSLRITPKVLCVGIKAYCSDGDKDIPEAFICDNFIPCELLEEL